MRKNEDIPPTLDGGGQQSAEILRAIQLLERRVNKRKRTRLASQASPELTSPHSDFTLIAIAQLRILLDEALRLEKAVSVSPSPVQEITFSDLSPHEIKIDIENLNYHIFLGDLSEELDQNQSLLLNYLFQHIGEVVTYDDLINQMYQWKSSKAEVYSKQEYVRVTVGKLRRVLAKLSKRSISSGVTFQIANIYGIGYRFNIFSPESDTAELD